jgi:hypothetical protein
VSRGENINKSKRCSTECDVVCGMVRRWKGDCNEVVVVMSGVVEVMVGQGSVGGAW